MKKREIEKMLFDKFEQDVAQVRQKIAEIQREVDKELTTFKEKYGTAAVACLMLEMGGKPEVVSCEGASPRKKNTRKRRQLKSGESTIKSILDGLVPEFVGHYVIGEEFTAKSVFNGLKEKLPKHVTHSHVSLYLIKGKKALGLKGEQRVDKKEDGSSNVRTNYYKRLRRAKRS